MTEQPTNLVIFTDPGKDIDDECALVLLAALTRQKLVRPIAVVANLAPALQRARLARGTLDRLGYSVKDIPVLVGTSCGQKDDAYPHEFDVPYLADVGSVHGQGSECGITWFLRPLLVETPPESVTMLCLSGLTDIEQFMLYEGAVFKRHVRRVVIMGGVQVENEVVRTKRPTWPAMTPDTAANNAFDPSAASEVYELLQKWGKPTTTLMRHAAYAAQMPRTFYDDIAATGHPVGVRLRDAQRKSIEALWQTANLSFGDPGRGALPERCNRMWFNQTFCGGDAQGRTPNESIWDVVRGFQLYDPMTLLAAIPALDDRFYDPDIVTVGNSQHRVIGVTKERHGVKNPDDVRSFIHNEVLRVMMETLNLNS